MQPCLYCKYVKGSTTLKTLESDCWTIIPSNNISSQSNSQIQIQKTSARTIEEAIQTIQSHQKNNNGYINLPLFDFIPINRMVIDMLHLFLRISDRLSELLLNDLREADLLTNQKNLYVNSYIQFLSNTCRISNPAYSKDNKLFLRDLMGSERKKVYCQFEENFNQNLFPGFRKLEKIKYLWLIFYQTYDLS